jgi:hypothetical protein
MMPGQLTDTKQILKFMFAGNSTITFRSAKTGNRYTFKIREGKTNPPGGVAWPSAGPVHFVKVLAGADNTADYVYIGMIRDGKFTTRASKMGISSVPVKTFMWALESFQKGIIPELLEVWHEGRCGRCGRKLTVPESIASGFGPECSERMELPLVESPITPVIDQSKVKLPKPAVQQELPLNTIKSEQDLDNVSEIN